MNPLKSYGLLIYFVLLNLIGWSINGLAINDILILTLLPKAPAAPKSVSQCQLLRGEYLYQINQLHKTLSQCMEKPATIGRAQKCNGTYGLTAWPECSAIEIDICRVNDDMENEYRVCMDRLKYYLKQKPKSKGVDIKGFATDMYQKYKKYELLQNVLKAKEMYGQIKETFEKIRDPNQFFSEMPEILEAIKGDKTLAPYEQQDAIASVYQYAQQFAEKAIEKTEDPLIQKIQQKALQKVGEIHQEALQKVDHFTSALDEFVNDQFLDIQSYQQSNQNLTSASSNYYYAFNPNRASERNMQEEREEITEEVIEDATQMCKDTCETNYKKSKALCEHDDGDPVNCLDEARGEKAECRRSCL